jgi:predicted DNA-binding protein with PD1-like motif
VHLRDVLKTRKIQEEEPSAKNMKQNMETNAISVNVLEKELKIHWHVILTRQNGGNTNLTIVVQAC